LTPAHLLVWQAALRQFEPSFFCVTGFAGILDEFLALVVHVAVHNPNCCMARWLSRWLAC
jgi:hypothetical protein